MAEKTITLIVFQADRELWEGAQLRLQVTDVSKSPLRLLFDKRLGPNSSTILVKLDLLFDAGQVYGISVEAEKHRSAWQLINRRTFLRQIGGVEVEVKDVVMRLMLVPKLATSSDLTNAYQELRDQGSPMVSDAGGLSENSYLTLKRAEQMALLNIEAKLRETRLNADTLLPFVEEVRLVTVDRLFLFVRSDLKQIIEDSSEFASAPGHRAPRNTAVALPDHPNSWKHRRFGAGNLQLSFSSAVEPLPSNPSKSVYSVDVDIDLERGIGHVLEWLDNNALHPGRKTDQALVYTLLFSQGIFPHYTLDPASSRLG